MKDLIKKILREYEEEEQKILQIPSLKYFNYDWSKLQKFLQLKGNPFYAFNDNLNLRNTPIESLGNLKSVGGKLNLKYTPISKKYSEEEIRQMVNVGGQIFM